MDTLKGRVLLVVLLVIPLVFVIAYSREDSGGPLHTAQSAMSGITAPLKVVGGAVGAGTELAETAIQDSGASSETLEALRQQNEELREQIAQLEEYRQSAQRLESLLGLRDTYQLETATARVISSSPNPWMRVVTIDKGSNDGVKSGLTVMGPNGVVGQIIATTPFTADVRLLQDPQSGVAVIVQSTRAEGILRGSLEGLLYLEDVSVDSSVVVGDVVITSGLGGSYNRGLIIGMVVRVDQAKDGATRKIVVAPNSETGSLQEVLVVLKMNSEGALAQPTTTAVAGS